VVKKRDRTKWILRISLLLRPNRPGRSRLFLNLRPLPNRVLRRLRRRLPTANSAIIREAREADAIAAAAAGRAVTAEAQKARDRDRDSKATAVASLLIAASSAISDPVGLPGPWTTVIASREMGKSTATWCSRRVGIAGSSALDADAFVPLASLRSLPLVIPCNQCWNRSFAATMRC